MSTRTDNNLWWCGIGVPGSRIVAIGRHNGLPKPRNSSGSVRGGGVCRRMSIHLPTHHHKWRG
jgi:hypothetical protein